ncbi:hypothetical protein M9H77_13981 [Catharanthus roseus]|uniref:Uncharacterized protein n=1 Tax=Catharanthus roseus TaxID=4058 RepID=A0ACC0BM02_CATRO|nr:hypothetical protein M9H77_13981 [Catharanthus roseus]
MEYSSSSSSDENFYYLERKSKKNNSKEQKKMETTSGHNKLKEESTNEVMIMTEAKGTLPAASPCDINVGVNETKRSHQVKDFFKDAVLREDVPIELAPNNYQQQEGLLGKEKGKDVIELPVKNENGDSKDEFERKSGKNDHSKDPKKIETSSGLIEQESTDEAMMETKGILPASDDVVDETKRSHQGNDFFEDAILREDVPIELAPNNYQQEAGKPMSSTKPYLPLKFRFEDEEESKAVPEKKSAYGNMVAGLFSELERHWTHYQSMDSTFDLMKVRTIYYHYTVAD